MHEQVLDFLTRMRERRPDAFAAGRVLEAGSYEINGTPRGLFETVKDYTGLDWRPGPGVDVIGLAHTYDAAPFATVVSTEMLEHDPHWQASLTNLARLVAPGGALLVTCAGPGRPAHEMDCAPAAGYYRGLSAVEVVTVLRQVASWTQIHAEQHDAPSDTYVACFGKLAETAAPEVCIVVPAVGNVALTAACVSLARTNAGCPVEIVLVDNGSKPEHAWQLASLPVEVYLHYDKLIGYPAACNRGAAVGRGTYLCLLNNDAEPQTVGWARRLVTTLEAHGGGLVAPVTDMVANPEQQARCATDRAPFAAKTLFFVCVLLRRSLWEAVGPLDEQFGLGNCEDKDYCLRVRELGLPLTVDPGVFVAHKGHATFGRLPEGLFNALLMTNERKLGEKYPKGVS